MDKDSELKEQTDKILAAIEKRFGFIPVVNKVTSERPDIFVPSVVMGQAVLERDDGALQRKQRYLCAISAATALGGEHCVRVQMKHARDVGATKDEIFEAIMIGSYMAMTRSQSYALRAFADEFGIEY